MFRTSRFLIVAQLLFASASAIALDFHAGPEDYRAYLTRLAPGDRLLLGPGNYLRGLPLKGLAGEPGRPIRIEGADQGALPRFVSRPGANTISLTDVRHITISNLELDGVGQFVDAVKAEGHAKYAHFVTLENLYIHDHASSQQNVGISTKCPAFGWIIRNNRIERVGTGIYLGNSDGTAPFVSGLIEGNRIAATLGYNLQIKHQIVRPVDIPEPELPHDTIIRHNVFDKSDAGSAGAMARPNVLIGHMPLAGHGVTDRTLIYANFFWRNPGESLFQGEGNIFIYNNLFVTHGPDAVRVQPHNAVPREVRILFNTVVSAGNGITVRAPEDSPFDQIVAGNVVFAERPFAGGRQTHNKSGGYNTAGTYLVRPYAEAGDLDLSPKPNANWNEPVELRFRQGLPGIDMDYSGKRRPVEAIGALVRNN